VAAWKKKRATSEHPKNGLADRLIVATAIVLGVPLVTVDQSLLDWSKKFSQIQNLPL
jgi:PIN domain nuclease of toxin-antitoxin system